MSDVLKPLRVFLEYDERTSFDMVRHYLDSTTRHISFTFVKYPNGRWLVPSLCGYGDVALFIDDYIVDIANLWKQIKTQELCAVYVPTEQKDWPRPKIMLFRNKYCERLTPEYVYSATPEQLAPSVWAGGPQNVGTLEVR